MSFDFGNSEFRVFDGKAYVLIGPPDLTWQQAEQQAQQFNGHLVTINNQAENDFLANAFSGKRFWIGLNDAAQEGVFEWSSGEAVTFTNFASGEPNNSGNEDFVEFNFRNPGQWNDQQGSDRRWGVAEIDLEVAPEITSDGGGDTADVSAMENMAFVTTVTAADDFDSTGDGLTYSIVGGADASLFQIDANTGDLSFINTPDFENPGDTDGDNNYQVSVQVQDVGVTLTDAFRFTWRPSDGGRFVSNDGGQFDSASIQFSPETNEFIWRVDFSDQVTDGLTLVTNDGGRSFLGQPGQFARLYLDGTDPNNPVLSAFAFNGVSNTDSTLQDGNGSGSGIVAPDFIASSLNDNFNPEITITDTADGGRIFEVSFDATLIQDHVPLYGDPDQWSGLSFDENIGLSLQTYDNNLSPTYNNDGRLTDFFSSSGGFGFISESNFTATTTPIISREGPGLVDTQDLTIQVTDQNDAPNAANDAATTIGGTPVTINVLANDTDPDGDAPLLQNVTQPANGTVTLLDNGTPTNESDDTVLYTPNADFAGTDTFTYSISDGNGATDTATVTVNVAPAPDFDNDGTPDLIDLDDDNDGLADVAEANLGTNPLSPDSDGDGIQDGTEVGETVGTPDSFGGDITFIPDADPTTTTNPLDNDTDDDGLLDGVEDANGDGASPNTIGGTGTTGTGETDPNNPDTDGDLLADGVEVIAVGTNPLDTDTDDGSVDDGTEVLEQGTEPVNTPGDDVIQPTGQIAGQVRNDLDGDGNRNDPDQGLAGATVQLFADFDGNNVEDPGGPLQTVTTGANGQFNFTGLAEGDYIVREINPDGFTSTADSNGGGSLDRVIDVNPGDNVVFLDTADAPPTASISGQVRNDLDGDGNPNDLDPGLAGATIGLFPDFDRNNVEDSAAIQVATTGADGTFSFDNLPDGDYILRELDPDGFTSTADSNGFNPNRIIDVNPGDEPVFFLDTAAAPTGQISGQVRNDLDGDGALGDPDPGLAGATVQLFADFDGNNVEDPGGPLQTVTTGANGQFNFTGLADGDYIVREVNPDGFTSTADSNRGGSFDRVIDVNPGDNVVFLNTADATGVIAGQVRNDLDGDGRPGDPDPGLEGAKIDLFADFNGDNIEDGPALQTVFTDANGNFSFEGLVNGDYIIQETNPVGFESTADSNRGGSFDRVIDVNPGENVFFLDTAASPIAVDDSGATIGLPVTIDVLANDSAPALLQSFTQPSNGTVTLDNNGTPTNESDDRLIYTPNAGFVGDDAFQYTISDLEGSTDTATVRVEANTPLALDLNRDGLIGTRGLDQGVQFDILETGVKVNTGWLAGEEGFLAIDTNGDGQISDRTELFGGSQVGDGFAKLASFDSNGDTVVDGNDALFGELLIWQDANENGITDGGELTDLLSAGIAAVNTSYTNVFEADAQGNVHGEVGSAIATDGSLIKTTDIYFQVGV